MADVVVVGGGDGQASGTPVVREPIVLPFDVPTGWRRASTARRILALLCPGLLLAWVVLALLPAPDVGASGGPVPWELAYLVVGPPACYAAARVLRPYPGGPRGERPFRHGCAAVGTAYGLVLIIILLTDADLGLSDQWGAVYVGLAAMLGPGTAVWGVCAALVRLAGAMSPR